MPTGTSIEPDNKREDREPRSREGRGFAALEDPSKWNTSLSDGLRKLADNAKSTGNRLKDSAVQAASTAADTAKQTVEDAGRQVSIAVARGLHWVGSEPDGDPSLLEKLVKFAPIIGETKTYADAWKKYHQGKQQGDSQMLHRARVECLMAFTDAGIDIVTLGSSRPIRSSRALRSIVRALKVATAIKAVAKVKVDLTEKLAERMVQQPLARKIADGFLDAVQPLG